MEEIEFFMSIDHDGERCFYDKNDIKLHVKSDSDDPDELIEMWLEHYQSIKLIRMIGTKWKK